MKPQHALAALLALPLALGEGEVEISTAGGPFATFHHGEGDRVPFLWPVLGPGGVEVTRAFPMEAGREGESPDHPHHTSLWFAHGDINGVDFWALGLQITGIASLGTAFLVVCWLLAAATSDAAYATMNGLLTGWFGDLVMLLAAWAIWYHMLGRLRHVIWDFGFGLDLATSEKMGWGMFIGATVLTLFTIIVV